MSDDKLIAVCIHAEEWYPVYSISRSADQDEIPESKILWIERVAKEFQETQDYLSPILAAGEKRREEERRIKKIKKEIDEMKVELNSLEK